MRSLLGTMVVFGIVWFGSAAHAAAVCGNGFPEAGEDCDDGGTCIGNANAGMPCHSVADCGGPAAGGVCEAGSKAGSACAADGDCPTSQCIGCKTFGGDGCAANCTNETDTVFNLVPGDFDENDPQAIRAGTSGGVAHGESITQPLPFGSGCSGGSNDGRPCQVNADCPEGGACLPAAQTLTFGRDRGDGMVPVVVKASSVRLPRIDAGGIGCACLRALAQKTCGGTLFNADGVTPTTDCTDGFSVGPSVCPADKPCTFAYGTGNAAAGVVTCSSTGLTGVDIDQTVDAGGCNNPPNCTQRTPHPPVITRSGGGPPGSALLLDSGAVGTAVGSCFGDNVTVYGADREFCTVDDPPAARGTPQVLRLTTGTACATLTNANFAPPPKAVNLGPFCTTGAPFDCSAFIPGGSPGRTLAGAFVALEQPSLGDTVVTTSFVAVSPAATTPTMTPTGPEPTPTSSPPPACTGDCDGNGAVTVDELLTMVNIALGNAPVAGCDPGDADGSGEITIDEILTAVNNLLGACP